jgi:CRISPR-associated exonuclease Cas4
VVEFTAVESSPSPEGVQLPGREGRYLPAPVEYKRGREKHDRSDEAQLCAQAMCLEDMLAVSIPVGYIYYGQTRRRVTVELSGELRDWVRKAAQEMHAYYQRGYTPRQTSPACRSCSLADACLPMLQDKTVPASNTSGGRSKEERMKKLETCSTSPTQSLSFPGRRERGRQKG